MSKELGNTFFHLARELLQNHTALWHQEISELTKPQYSVLCALEKAPGIEQNQLMKIALSTKATLAEMLVRMEKKNLIERRYDEFDKRRRFIFLTSKGLDILKKSHPLAEEVDNHFLLQLTTSEQVTLSKLLKKMIINPT